MTKKAKVLFFLLLIALLLILYLVLTSESVKPANRAVPTASQKSKNPVAVLSEDAYKAEVKTILAVYEKSSQDNNFTVDQVAGLRNRLLALKGLPAKFKELHLKLVFSFDKMENYLKQQDQQGKVESQRMVSQLKADYSWLNN